jgi:hypothetical protein
LGGILWPANGARRERLGDARMTHRDKRDERLWALLPSKSEPYDCCKLSKAETEALIEALGDGFGDVFVAGREPLPLPTKVNSGLLDHRFYSADTEYDADEWENAFWSRGDEDLPAPAEIFPLHLHRRRLRVYFGNQFDRFCEKQVREDERYWKQQRLENPEFELPPLRSHRGNARYRIKEMGFRIPGLPTAI